MNFLVVDNKVDLDLTRLGREGFVTSVFIGRQRRVWTLLFDSVWLGRFSPPFTEKRRFVSI